MPPALVLLTDADGRVLHANSPARALLGTCEARTCCELLQTDCMGGGGEAGGYTDCGSVTANGVVGTAGRSAMGGQFVVVMQPRGVLPSGIEALSPRELDVLRLVARGLTDLAVSERIGLQHATVRSHMENVRRKLKVRSRSQAVARAVAAGIL